MKFFITLFTVFLLFPAVARPETAAGFTYSKASITIVRKALQPALPWRNAALPLDVEIRDARSLYSQNGWYNLSAFAENTGVMMVFDAEETHPITHSSHYAPADILFVDARGKIIQIAPNISLAELREDIYPASPILAYLFLKGGTCEQFSINPNDEIESPLFKKPPLILGTPTGEPSISPLAAPVKTVTDLPLPPPAVTTKPNPVLQSF